ncbi:hypothetical protein GN244_ATG19890 [Phytophthora infestans]|uniref:Uncharacterized protein n=1 Tax=Phytophthora infestans TaxID=4787 RepID=A0A833W3R5_PHYIN|nr:hypothetical protein GN244_ATG19890 [Phytophthora infestans]KAF4135500.1 hypothetical protein GN958_ATG15299 [Phytophthora infestans]KAF4136071.1 hypothetical protein GN958_ATG14741 [Phytophthora infestans]
MERQPKLLRLSYRKAGNYLLTLELSWKSAEPCSSGYDSPSLRMWDAGGTTMIVTLQSFLDHLLINLSLSLQAAFEETSTRPT